MYFEFQVMGNSCSPVAGSMADPTTDFNVAKISLTVLGANPWSHSIVTTCLATPLLMSANGVSLIIGISLRTYAPNARRLDGLKGFLLRAAKSASHFSACSRNL